MASYSKSDEFIDLLEEILKDIDEIKKTMDKTFKVNVDGGENHVEKATQVDEKKDDPDQDCDKRHADVANNKDDQCCDKNVTITNTRRTDIITKTTIKNIKGSNCNIYQT